MDKPSHISMNNGRTSSRVATKGSVAFLVRQRDSSDLKSQRDGCAGLLTERSHINVQHERHTMAPLALTKRANAARVVCPLLDEGVERHFRMRSGDGGHPRNCQCRRMCQRLVHNAVSLGQT